MNENITIRGANAEDGRGIAELMGQLGYPAESVEVTGRLTRFSASDSEQVIVAEQNKQILGVIGIHLIPLLHTSGNLGRIIALVINKEDRRKEIGQRLVLEAESWAWSHGCYRVEVTSGDHRSDAHRFYEECGYRCDERRFLKQRENGSQPAHAHDSQGCYPALK
jgi:GNAT superfamily N-acetyltransferase